MKCVAVSYTSCPDCEETRPGPALDDCGHGFHQTGDGVVLEWYDDEEVPA